MKKNKWICLSALVLRILFPGGQDALLDAKTIQESNNAMEVNVKNIPAARPRLFLANGGVEKLRKNAESPMGKALAERILHD